MLHKLKNWCLVMWREVKVNERDWFVLSSFNWFVHEQTKSQTAHTHIYTNMYIAYIVSNWCSLILFQRLKFYSLCYSSPWYWYWTIARRRKKKMIKSHEKHGNLEISSKNMSNLFRLNFIKFIRFFSWY